MQKCDPVNMRKNLAIVELFSKSGIDFVAIPIKNPSHKKEMLLFMEQCLEEIERQSEESND
jgi:hypothetical protein